VKYLRQLQQAVKEGHSSQKCPDTEVTKVPKPVVSPLAPASVGVSRRIVEAVLAPADRSVPTEGRVFPQCPECGSQRYWISGSKVICGTRRCGAVRWVLTQIEFHKVN
jgi:hypothetical protein